MWLSRKFGTAQKETAEAGTVSIGGSSVLKTVSTVQSEEVKNYAPYGYSAYAPDGEEILIINGRDGAASPGTKMKDEALSEGEISIKSAGGAQILLKKNGNAEINGFVFTQDGRLLSPGGEVIYDSKNN